MDFRILSQILAIHSSLDESEDTIGEQLLQA